MKNVLKYFFLCNFSKWTRGTFKRKINGPEGIKAPPEP